MAITESFPVTKSKAYQRPYKSRQERRKAARNQVDDSSDHKFLLRVAVGLGLLVLLVIGFAVKGLADRDNATAAYPSAVE